MPAVQVLLLLVRRLPQYYRLRRMVFCTDRSGFGFSERSDLGLCCGMCLRRRLGSIAIVALLFVANTFNIGADLGAMAAASRLLLPAVPTWAYLLVFSFICMAANSCCITRATLRC
jgi:hypothetical protein